MCNLRKNGIYSPGKERNRLWRGFVTAIAALVVFSTTAGLILPAATLETEGFTCGLPEHTHTADCYQLTCGKQEYFSHAHTQECDQDGQLVCTLTERECHHHSADCYSKAQPVCGQEETKGHTHTEACFEVRPQLVCGQEETPGHAHSEDCYTDGVLTCGKEETEGHTHGPACSQEQRLCICGQEEIYGHAHSEACYPVDFQPELICGKEDIPEHRHSQDCYTRICELEEHTHSELCGNSQQTSPENQKEGEAVTDAGDEPTRSETAPQTENLAQSDATLDLKDYLTQVSTDPAPAYQPEHNKITLGLEYAFAIPKSEGKVPSFNYRLALEGLNLSGIVDEETMEKRYDLEDAEKGTYWFSQENGIFYLNLSLKEAYIAKAGESIDGKLSFRCDLDDTKLDDKGELTISYGDSLKLSITPSDYYKDFPGTTLDYQISADKTSGYSREGGDRLKYTVNMSSTKGTPELTFTDHLLIRGENSSILHQEHKQIVVKKGTMDGEGHLLGTTETIADLMPQWQFDTNQSGDRTTADLSVKLPALQKNEYYEITCEYGLNALADSYSYQLSNRAEASGSGNRGQTVTASDNQDSTFSSFSLEKEGVYSGDQIHWTITVNSSNLDIHGLELTDELFDGAVIRIVPSEGCTETTYTTEDNGQHKKIVFDPVDADGTNKQEYVIAFDTDVPAVFGTLTVGSTAKLTYPGGEIRKYQEVSCTNGSMAKALTSMKAPEGETQPILSWQVRASVPSAGVKAGTMVSDSCDQNGEDGKHHFIRDSVKVLDSNGQELAPETITVKYYGNASSTDSEADEHDPASYMQIRFNQDYHGESFAIVYETQADADADVGDSFCGIAESGQLSASAHTPTLTKEGTLDSLGASAVWTVKAAAGDPAPKKITLVETLPQGTSLALDRGNLKIGESSSGSATELTVAANTRTEANSTGATAYKYSAQYTESSRQLQIEIQRADGQSMAPDAGFEVTYLTDVDKAWVRAEMAKNTDSYALTSYTRAFFDEIELLPVFKTLDWRDEDASSGENVLKKSGQWDEKNHVLSYSLKLNPHGVTMDPNSDTVTITDVLSYQQGQWGLSCTFKFGSLRVYTANADGSLGAALSPALWSYGYSDNTSELNNENKTDFQLKKQLVLTVPDSMPLVIAYQYDVRIRDYQDVEHATQLRIGSSARITSIENQNPEEITTEASYRAVVSQGSLSTANRFTFRTKSSADGSPLSGAVFGLWQAVYRDGQWVWEQGMKEYTSGGEEGTFHVSKLDGYEENVLYKLQEVAAPSGFRLPNPAPEYRFFFSNTQKDMSTMPDSTHEFRSGAVDLSLTIGMAEIVNSPLDTISITVQKLWRDIDGNPLPDKQLPDSVSINLYKRPMGTQQAGTLVRTITLQKPDWQQTVSGLPVEDDMEYCLEEVPVEGFISLEPVAVGENSFTITGIRNTTSITVQMCWTTGYDSGVIPGDSVRFKLFRRVWDSVPTAEQMNNLTWSPEEYGSVNNLVSLGGSTEFSLTMAGRWRKTFADLPVSEEVDGVRKFYSYYIVEQPSKLYDCSYGDARETLSGTLRLSNTLCTAYTLPSTGGRGTTVFYTVGSILVIGALLLISRKRLSSR